MLFNGRYFTSAEQAALQFQYEARLRSCNARQTDRFGLTHCIVMQREASILYAAAREALSHA
jgi:hypothetical protein